jgi:hypothetical protein
MLKSFILLFTCCLVFTSGTALAQCSGSNLAAPYNSNNSNKGVMFNLTAANTVTILCFDANLPVLSVGGYEIYYKTGTYVGYETNAASWTLLGSAGGILSIGLNLGTALNIPVNLIIPAGQTYGFYITASSALLSTGLLTTSNSGYSTIASNANLSILGGEGVSYPFSSVTANRSFNGTVHYSLGTVLPVTFTQFNASTMNQFALLEWEMESEANTNFYEIERSADGVNWEKLIITNASGNESSTHLKYQEVDYNPLDGINYYRLSQTDNNGNHVNLQTVSWKKVQDFNNNELNIFPNPGKDIVRVFANPAELRELRIFDAIGQNISESIEVKGCSGYTELNFGSSKPGLFIVKTKTLSKRVMIE